MNIAYSRLLEIKMLNKYYTDWICRDFSIVPTPATRAIMKNYQLLARPTDGGLVILARVDDQDNLLVPIPPADGFKLVFELKLNTPFFLNFTNLPLQGPSIDYLNAALKPAYYFTNLYDNEHSAGEPVGDLKLLSKTTGLEVSAADQIIYWPKIANIRLPAEANSFSLELKTPDGSNFQTINISESQNFLQRDVKFTSVPAGNYLISFNGGADAPIYLDDDFYQRAPFGLIEVFHHSGVPAAYQFVAGANHNEIDFQTYHIWFDNRSAVWRYIYPAGTPGNYNIRHMPSGDRFTGQTIGERVIYSSPNDLALQEGYQLVRFRRSGENFKLPNPDGTILKPVVNGGGNIIGYEAEVYV